MRSSPSPHSFGTRTHAVTCALWTSSAAGRSTIVSTSPPSGRAHRTVAQGPQKRSSLTVVLAAQSGVPGRPRTPNSKQAHGHQGKDNGVAGDPGIIASFHTPARVRDSGQMNSKQQRYTVRLLARGSVVHSGSAVRLEAARSSELQMVAPPLTRIDDDL